LKNIIPREIEKVKKIHFLSHIEKKLSSKYFLSFGQFFNPKDKRNYSEKRKLS